MSDSFVIDELGNCRNKFQSTKKYGKVEIYPIVDTMNENHTVLFCNELLEQKLNQMTNNYVNAVQENEKLIAILRDLNIDEDYYWDNKPQNHDSSITNVPVHFIIPDNIEFAIKEMVCTLKNLDGEYTYCKGRLRRTYASILSYLSNGGIKVRSAGTHSNFKCKITFSKEWEQYDVPKSWEKDPLSSQAKFNAKIHSKKVQPKRKPISGRVRQNVFMRDNYTCQICGKTIDDGVTLHLDHIQPVSKGGSDKENNLQVLCSQCNLEKHNRTDLLHDKRKLKQLNG